MTPQHQEPIRKRACTRQFLFSKTDHKFKRDAAAKTTRTAPDLFSQAYPQIQSGRGFLEKAVSGLEKKGRFSAMVVRIDSLRTEDPSDQYRLMMDCLLATAETIASVCQETGGMWGRLRSAELGCFFPGKTNFFGLKTAKRIRKQLAGRCRNTVSIGIAAYPSVTFEKSQIIDNAYKALDHAAFFGPGSTVSFDAVSLNISGDKRYQVGDISGAVAEFNTALLLDPANVNVHNSLGVCYAFQGAFEKALEAFAAAIRLDPGEIMAVYNTGLVHMLSGRHDQALNYLLKALSISEDVFEIQFQTGRLHLELADLEKAAFHLEKAVALQPSSGPANRCLGDCYSAAERSDKAVAAYRQAIKLNPNDAAALSALGALFGDLRENSEIALMFCRQSIAIAPDNGLFRHRLGVLCLKQNMPEAAYGEFRQALRLGHDSSRYIERIEQRRLRKAS